MFHVSQSLLGSHSCTSCNRLVEMDHQDENKDQFFYRLGGLPIVSSAWSNTLNLYNKTKDHNALFRTTLNIAEASMWTVAGTARPIVGKCVAIEQVNDIACQQLAKLEAKYPSITHPTDQLVQESKDACFAYVKPAFDKVSNMKQYGTDKYNGVVAAGKDKVDKVLQLSTNTITNVKSCGQDLVTKSLEMTYGQVLVNGMDGLLTMSENYVDTYLPSDEDQSGGEEKDGVEKKAVPSTNPVSRATALTMKVRRRMYKKAMKDIRSARKVSLEALTKLNITVDLMDYAKNNIDQARSKVKDTWTKILTKEDPDFVPQNMEEKTIAMARHLTQQVRHNIGSVAVYMVHAPDHIKACVTQAEKYAEDMLTTFVKNKELPSWVVDQTKERIMNLQQLFLYTTDLLLSSPLNWLVPKSNVDVIEMSETVSHKKE